MFYHTHRKDIPAVADLHGPANQLSKKGILASIILLLLQMVLLPHSFPTTIEALGIDFRFTLEQPASR